MPQDRNHALKLLCARARTTGILMMTLVFLATSLWAWLFSQASWLNIPLSLGLAIILFGVETRVTRKHFAPVFAAFDSSQNLSRRDLDIFVARTGQFRDIVFAISLSAFAVLALVTILTGVLTNPHKETAFVQASLLMALGFAVCVIRYADVIQKSRASIEVVMANVPVHRLNSLTHTVSRLGLRERFVILSLGSGLAPILGLGSLVVIRAKDPSIVPLLLLLLLLLVSVGVGGYALWLTVNLLVSPMGTLAARANALAEGTLKRETFIATEDELWELSLATLLGTQIVSEVVRELDRTTSTLNAAADEVRGLSKSSVSKGDRQAGAVVEIATTSAQLTQVAEQMSATAKNVAQIAVDTLASAQKSQHNAQMFVESVTNIEKNTQEVMSGISQLSKRINQISKITEFIHTLGDKTEVLALNAELEAFRAGAAGSGFSLVATEMRRVAETVMRSARDIDSLTTEIREATRQVETTSQKELNSVRTGVSASAKLNEAVSNILGLAKSNADAVQAVSTSSEEQHNSFEHLREALRDVTASVQESAVVSHHLDDASQKLVALADKLRGVVGSFRIV